MANVTMDIAELDALRSEIQSLKNEKENLTKELYDVKADKKVLMITKSGDPMVETIYFNIPLKSGNSFSVHDVCEILKNPMDYSESAFRIKTSYCQVVPVSVPKKFHPKKEDEKVFVNFEDVFSQLRDKVEADFASELAELRRFKLEQNIREEELKKGFNARMENFDRVKDETIAKIKERHEKKIEEYQKEIDKLNTSLKNCIENKKEQTYIQQLEEEIKKLKEELGNVSKNWFSKLLK
jgi:predicted RNase H-like nuclease (RuvC/YqgF family)